MNFLVWLAIIPSIIIGVLIYKADKVEKEPKRELVKSFLMGIVSVIITLVISKVLGITKINYNELNSTGLILYIFLGIALIEEVSKLISTKLVVRNNENYNYLFDGIVYSVFVSLGFATIENVLYTLQGGIITGIMRGIVTVPSHAFYAIFMGYYLSKSKENKIKKDKNKYYKYSLYSIIIPTILHGTFDTLLLLNKQIFLIIFMIFVVILYAISIKKVKQLASEEKLFIQKTINYCSDCGYKINGKYCSNCGKKVL